MATHAVQQRLGPRVEHEEGGDLRATRAGAADRAVRGGSGGQAQQESVGWAHGHEGSRAEVDRG